MEEHLGLDVGAGLAGRHRGGEQAAQRGPESLVKIRRQGVKGGVARVQRLGEAPLGRDEVRIALQPARQRLERRVFAREYRSGVGARVDLTPEHGGDQLRPLGKMTIDRADADAGPFGDIPHRRIDPRRREHSGSRFEQAADVALRVGTPATAALGSARQCLVPVNRDIGHAAHPLLYKRNNVPYKTECGSALLR